MTLTNLKIRLKFDQSNILTSTLLAFVVSMLLLIIFTAQTTVPVEATTETQSYKRELAYMTSESLYPGGIRPAAPLKSANPPVVMISPSPEATTAPQRPSKLKQKPDEEKVIQYTESISSTPVSRDDDRFIIGQALADRISQYFISYGKHPILYSSKSHSVLLETPSDTVYLYNENENRVNALGMNLGNDSYQFVKVETCDRRSSIDQDVMFMYTNDSIYICKETQGQERFWIAH